MRNPKKQIKVNDQNSELSSFITLSLSLLIFFFLFGEIVVKVYYKNKTQLFPQAIKGGLRASERACVRSIEEEKGQMLILITKTFEV